CIIRPVWQWVRLQVWLHCRHGNASCIEVGHGGLHRLRQSQAKSLIREKEEGPVFDDRAAECAAKIVLSLPRFGKSRLHRSVEPIVGIQNVVAQIIEDRSVELVRARASNDRDLSTRLTAKFRRIGGGLNTEFLKSIHGNQTVCPPEHTEGTKRAAHGISLEH